MTNLRQLARGQECRRLSERWRPVIGFEGAYEVSDFGRVRSVARWVKTRTGKRLIDGRVLKRRKTLGMYWGVCLCLGNSDKYANIHRLVAEAFVPGCGDVVRHLDGNGFNNHVSNLMWGSYAENEADKERHGRRPKGEAHPNSKMTDGHVRAIRDLHARGFTQLAIAAALGLNRGVVGIVVRGEGWTHVG